jgi:two-component system cell cycle sensor histidine kinase/response regulator CckA
MRVRVALLTLAIAMGVAIVVVGRPAQSTSLLALGLLVTGLAALVGVSAWNRALRSQVHARTREVQTAVERLELHAIVNSQVSDAIVVMTDERQIIMWNASAEALFRIPAAMALGASADVVLGSLYVDKEIDRIRKIVDREGIWRGETTIRRGGVDVYVEAMVQKLVDANGASAGRLIVARDIDARKRSEEERRRLEAQMQQVQKLESLGVLAGGIAHDFNNLLVGMLGHAGLALMDVPNDSPLRNRIQQIETCAMRAAELTNQMLAYSGKGRFVVQPLDLTAVVREMTNLLQTAISKSARLDLQLTDGLPAISADGAQLRQVIMNLITNASDALDGDAGTIRLTTGVMSASRAYLAETYVSSAEPGDYVYLEVSDTGCGMDPATRERIFEPFFTTKVTGRGLGLAAVLGIIRGHKGAVRIDSTPGEGTTFRVLFPSAAAAVLATPKPESRSRTRRHARILVVDDEPSVRGIARDALTRAGFAVAVAASGEEALQRIRSEGSGIHAVLLDMTMPGLDGVATLRAIHRIVERMPVVLTSGYSEEDAAARCDGEKLAGFIQKPFPPSALVDKIDRALGGVTNAA